MTTRKRILFVTPRIPFPPNRGDTIRTFHQLQHLARRHDVYLACFQGRHDDARALATLRSLCKEVFCVPANRSIQLFRGAWCSLRRSSAMVGGYRHRKLTARIAQWSAEAEFDVATGFSAVTAPFVLAAPARRRVLDLCDADSEKWREYADRSRWPLSVLYQREHHLLGAFEKSCIKRFDALIVICDRERRAIDPNDRYSRIRSIANGTTLGTSRRIRAAACGPLIGFVGRLDYRPNIEGLEWFVSKAWARVKARQKGARLYLVGANPSARIHRLTRHDDVILVGEVPDPREHIARWRLVIAPLLTARGLQNKALEAMAMGRPLVVTSAVADGLLADPCKDLCVADDPNEFAEAVVRICESDEQCTILSRRGSRCVETNYSWPDILANYESVLLGEARANTAIHSRERALIAGSADRPTRPRSLAGAVPRGPRGESWWPEGTTLDRMPRGLPIEPEVVR